MFNIILILKIIIADCIVILIFELKYNENCIFIEITVNISVLP